MKNEKLLERSKAIKKEINRKVICQRWGIKKQNFSKMRRSAKQVMNVDDEEPDSKSELRSKFHSQCDLIKHTMPKYQESARKDHPQNQNGPDIVRIEDSKLAKQGIELGLNESSCDSVIDEHDLRRIPKPSDRQFMHSSNHEHLSQSHYDRILKTSSNGESSFSTHVSVFPENNHANQDSRNYETGTGVIEENIVEHLETECRYVSPEDMSLGIPEEDDPIAVTVTEANERELLARKSKFRIAIKKEASYIPSTRMRELVSEVKQGKVRLKEKLAKLREEKHTKTQVLRKSALKYTPGFHRKSMSGSAYVRPKSSRIHFKKAHKADPRSLKMEILDSEGNRLNTIERELR
jgi:hypothetical protein